ncbi:MAG: protease modulator HflC [Acidithiobacillus ferriphilus]|jgi:protease FtsH subunit HflC|uniref:Protein HflC n=2 Tax=Acidithiobacillus TaxID=119977 RepID=A0A179BA62_ACIFR|nr:MULTISPECIES: protease modulator HflC [Acidithiobacillus]MDA8180905.1 protease modulator HflC [Acidithiobacillus sp.]MBU2826621.1 protease modulator HflC [Acidithiobacillus ferriphilus]MBU2829001.1 protease modulator HflC [Acidithiobacillus ferriphilus]MBU2832904.1 protease modulator HflC [Acidithiobacillus ferriphilus]MBU2853239.1 protease modulator HflC [Acidithiobacillus ferriphilus]
MKNWAWSLIVVVLALLLLASASFYSVRMTQTAVVLQFGKVVRVTEASGLHMKWPLVQNVEFIDNRLASYSTQPESFLTAEKKPVLISFFAEWQVVNPLAFYTRLHNDASAQSQIGDIVRSSLRGEIGTMTLASVIQGNQKKITEPVLVAANRRLRSLGVHLVDVRIMQVGLPPAVLQAVYKRMEAERTQEANAYRSRGAADAAEIRASADKEKTQIMADAYRQQEELKGQGDAEAASIYGAAYGKDPAFFSFYRSLETYRHSLGDKDILVLSPDSPFFKYFRHSLEPAGK